MRLQALPWCCTQPCPEDAYMAPASGSCAILAKASIAQEDQPLCLARARPPQPAPAHTRLAPCPQVWEALAFLPHPAAGRQSCKFHFPRCWPSRAECQTLPVPGQGPSHSFQPYFKSNTDPPFSHPLHRFLNCNPSHFLDPSFLPNRTNVCLCMHAYTHSCPCAGQELTKRDAIHHPKHSSTRISALK